MRGAVSGGVGQVDEKAVLGGMTKDLQVPGVEDGVAEANPGSVGCFLADTATGSGQCFVKGANQGGGRVGTFKGPELLDEGIEGSGFCDGRGSFDLGKGLIDDIMGGGTSGKGEVGLGEGRGSLDE